MNVRIDDIPSLGTASGNATSHHAPGDRNRHCGNIGIDRLGAVGVNRKITAGTHAGVLNISGDLRGVRRLTDDIGRICNADRCSDSNGPDGEGGGGRNDARIDVRCA